jgi:hypothetical protein
VYPPPALVESAFVEVCAGKACGKAGSAEIHAAIANAAPGTWRCEQVRIARFPNPGTLFDHTRLTLFFCNHREKSAGVCAKPRAWCG